MSMSVSAKRIPFFVAVVILLLGITIAVLPANNADAAEITARSLTLSSSNPAASNATTTYTFTFTVPTTATNILSLGVQVCTTADGTCTAPTGFSNASATLSTQPTGLGAASGWSIDASPPAANDLYISNASNATAPSGTQTVIFGNVQNPTTANQTFFGRITTYSDSAWTTSIDSGTTAASTTQLIVLTGTMPESLIFCTGATVNANCTTTTPGSVNFNQDFSPTSTAWATSQMAASTNALHGYAITVSGATMKNGTNSVTAIGATPAVSTPGTRQFGMNLASDTGAQTGDPVITGSSYESPTADNNNYMGTATTNFNIGDPSWSNAAQTSKFAFDDTNPNVIAKSDYSAGGGSTAGPTDAQIFTSSYIVNVSGNLPAGSYTTTLTYICTPEF